MNQLQKNAAAAQAISETCDQLKAMLLQKNEAYGNSAFEPVRCFSKADPKELIRVRMDDKVSRLMRGDNAGEDALWDLVGYTILERSMDRYQELVDPEGFQKSINDALDLKKEEILPPLAHCSICKSAFISSLSPCYCSLCGAKGARWNDTEN